MYMYEYICACSCMGHCGCNSTQACIIHYTSHVMCGLAIVNSGERVYDAIMATITM